MIDVRPCESLEYSEIQPLDRWLSISTNDSHESHRLGMASRYKIKSMCMNMKLVCTNENELRDIDTSIYMRRVRVDRFHERLSVQHMYV